MLLPLPAQKHVEAQHRHADDKAERHPDERRQQPHVDVGLQVECGFAFIETAQHLLFPDDEPFGKMLMEELCPFVFRRGIPKAVAEEWNEHLEHIASSENRGLAEHRVDSQQLGLRQC